MSLTVRAPAAGRVVALDDVPDPVFSGGLIGPGLAIDPNRTGREGSDTAALAPITGTLSKIHPHAYVIVSPEGRAVLVHLGVDTVELDGRGFTVRVAAGDRIRAGDPVISWSPARIEAGGRSPFVPVIALDAKEEALTLPPAGTILAAGDAACTWA